MATVASLASANAPTEVGIYSAKPGDRFPFLPSKELYEPASGGVVRWIGRGRSFKVDPSAKGTLEKSMRVSNEDNGQLFHLLIDDLTVYTA